MGFGTKAGSLAGIKASLQKGGGNNAFIKYVPKDSAMTVRFLQEPEEWFVYYDHFDKEARRSFPCTEERDSCPGCVAGMDSSNRYLANALDIDADRVIPLQLPKSLANRLVARYEKRGQLTESDYELTRSGTGKDTMYDLEMIGSPKRLIEDYEVLDLRKVLEDAYESYLEVVGDTDTALPSSVTKLRKRTEEPVKAEVEPEGDKDSYTEDELASFKIAQLRVIAREFGLKPANTWTNDDLIEKILDAQNEDDIDSTEPPF